MDERDYEALNKDAQQNVKTITKIDIENAIKETLVIQNKAGLKYAVKKIYKLINGNKDYEEQRI